MPHDTSSTRVAAGGPGVAARATSPATSASSASYGREAAHDGVVGQAVADRDEPLDGRSASTIDSAMASASSTPYSVAVLRAHTSRLAPLRKVRRVSSTAKPAAARFRLNSFSLQ